jgi:hypothetical protein
VQELPRYGLRILLFKVGEERRVGEVLESRRVIAHHVVGSREVRGEVTVASVALVGARIVAQESCGPIAGHSTFADSGDRGRVVTAVGECSVAHIVGGGHEGYLAKEAAVLEVAVSDGSVEVQR